MRTQRRLFSIATCGLFLVPLSAMRLVPPGPHTSPSPVACTLLTAADASTALERPSQPGKQLVNETGCVWSNDPALADSSRRVTLFTHSLIAFQAASHPAITTITVEPVSGIGDQAFYQIYPHNQNPFIWVRKGDVAFSIRIITRLDPRPFTNEQEKAKDAALAKAAVARL
ncbi:MAG: hypothetical protein ACREL5_03415 [Gemmatimonadales bacterium]